MLAIGEGVTADPPRARRLFDDTCKDDPRACSEFGNLFIGGRGVTKNLELGCHILDLACTYHDQDACNDLQYCPAKR